MDEAGVEVEAYSMERCITSDLNGGIAKHWLLKKSLKISCHWKMLTIGSNVSAP